MQILLLTGVQLGEQVLLGMGMTPIFLALTITGGGGFGARATAKVGNDGYITSITIIHGGSNTYLTITVHAGGWRKLGGGNAPVSDLNIQPGSGALLIRKHPWCSLANSSTLNIAEIKFRKLDAHPHPGSQKFLYQWGNLF